MASQAGIELLYRSAEASGLAAALTEHLAPFQKPGAVHDPGKVALDLVGMLAAGGDSPTDTAMLRGKQGLCGPGRLGADDQPAAGRPGRRTTEGWGRCGRRKPPLGSGPPPQWPRLPNRAEGPGMSR